MKERKTSRSSKRATAWWFFYLGAHTIYWSNLCRELYAERADSTTYSSEGEEEIERCTKVYRIRDCNSYIFYHSTRKMVYEPKRVPHLVR